MNVRRSSLASELGTQITPKGVTLNGSAFQYDESAPGQFGWDGGYGTAFYVDPENELIGILLTQKLWDAPIPPPVCADFWTHTYAGLKD